MRSPIPGPHACTQGEKAWRRVYTEDDAVSREFSVSLLLATTLAALAGAHCQSMSSATHS
jgi:hypothetical protein